MKICNAKVKICRLAILLSAILSDSSNVGALDLRGINWKDVHSRVAWLNSAKEGGPFSLLVDGTPALLGVPPGGFYDATKFPAGSFTAKIDGKGAPQQASFAFTVPAEATLLLITIPEANGKILPLVLENKKTAGQFVFVNATTDLTVRLIRRSGEPLPVEPGTIEILSGKDLGGFLSLEVTDPATGRKHSSLLPRPDRAVVTAVHLSGIVDDFCGVTCFLSEDFTILVQPDELTK